MARLAAVTSAILMSGTALSAGGLDRSGQPVGVLFDDGNVVELSYGIVRPDVSGVFTHPMAGPLGSGNVASEYDQLSLSFKMDVNEQLSFALILDQPFGATVSYAEPGYPLSGTEADLRSSALTALARYRINENFSVHGGIRAVSMEADLTVVSASMTGGAPTIYDAQFERDTAVGYVVGAAYEIPDIALRVALTWSSETEFSNVTHITGYPLPVPNTEFVMPQSVNLDFQTGVAADTLLFGSVRWVEWTATNISPLLYPDLVDYEKDRVTYTIGIGRRFSDAFSGAISFGYEQDQDLFVSNLSPTDGQMSIQVGGTYTFDNIEVTAGVRYLKIGDAVTERLNADFADNTAMAFGLGVAYRF